LEGHASKRKEKPSGKKRRIWGLWKKERKALDGERSNLRGLGRKRKTKSSGGELVGG